ncbi:MULTISPECIES: type II toxin-antitoxin system RelN family antitoxin [unclassified Microcoleus]|uniref:type II toxin-antitoxin system RelN family antitoxin n=1 Tax=unclassified Microcoleus TaxID=2642155 RepID=UPI0040408C32
MKAFEVTGTIDEKGQLLLDRPLTAETPGRVRIIVLFQEPTDEGEDDPDDTPVEEVKASLRRALQQAKAGQTRPISELWERIEAEKNQLLLDRSLTLDIPNLLRIILLLSEPTDETEEDQDDTPVAEIKASLKRALQEAKTGQRIPLSQMWEGIDVE